jgi:hypothetical protein
VGKFVDESAAQNSTIHDFFKAAQKESIKESSKNVTELKKVVDDNIDGADNQNIMQVQECGEIKPLANLKNSCEVMVSDMSKASSTSNSFFMKYLKQHSIATCSETNRKKVSVGKPESISLDNIDQPFSKRALDPDSEDDIFDCPVTDMEEPKEEKSSLRSRTTTAKLNLEASTSVVENQADDASTEMWVSLTELFPDISKVDDDVVALLPAPLQERIRARIEKAKQDSSISSKHASANLTSSDDSNLTDTPDSWFVGGRTQAETEQGTKVVKAIQVAECVTETEMQEQSCNRRKSPKTMNLLHQRDALLSKSSCILQGNREENFDLVEICDDEIFPPAAKQQCLGANHVPLNHRDEACTSSVSHCKTDASHAHHVTSVITSVSEESDTETSQDIVAETCPQCRKDVPLSEYPEHLDFHAAEKLHEELNGGAVHVRTAVTTSTVHKNLSELPTKRKRGRLPKKLSVTDCDKKMRSITAFFAPK